MTDSYVILISGLQACIRKDWMFGGKTTLTPNSSDLSDRTQPTLFFCLGDLQLSPSSAPGSGVCEFSLCHPTVVYLDQEHLLAGTRCFQDHGQKL